MMLSNQNMIGRKHIRKLAAFVLLSSFLLILTPANAAKGKSGGDSLAGTLVKKALSEVAGEIAGKVVVNSLDKGAASQTSTDLERELLLLAHNTNKQLPAMLDDETRLDRVELTYGLVLSMHHTLVGIERLDIDAEEFRNLAFEHLKKTVCDDAATRVHLNMNAIYAYTFNSDSGTYVTSVFIEGADCTGQ